MSGDLVDRADVCFLGAPPRSCMSSSMRWRSDVMVSAFRAAGTAQNTARRDVTRGERTTNPGDHAFGYPPKAD
jgi:hypothetical protein